MKRRLASRLGLVSTSPTIAIKMEAERLRREGRSVVDFGPGEPDLPSPEAVKRAGIQAIRDDFTHYTAAAGIHELREAIAARYAAIAGSPIEPGEVLVGVGGKQVLFSLMLSIVNPGDEVVIPAPYWVSFPDQVRLAGGTPVVAELDPQDGFTVRAEPVRRAITPATRAIIVNAPGNPSGAVMPREEARALADLAIERDLWLVSDETYEAFVYDEADRCSLLEERERLGGRLVFVSAFSKTWAMTGWRIGYAVAAPDVVRALLKVQSHDTTHAASISQRAALAALTEAADAPRAALETFRERRDLLLAGLEKIPGLRCARPRGAFYAFPDVRGLMEARGFPSSAELCRALVSEQAVACVPGEAFGAPGHVRLSYAASTETIEEGLRRLAAFAAAG